MTTHEEEGRVEVILSAEDEELLELGKKLRTRGKDPVKILNFYLDADATLEKTVALGKQAGNFIMNQLKDFEKEFRSK